MRTILAGLEVLRRSPLAFLPLSAESLAVGILIALAAIPADASSAAAAGVFPLGVYFDLKQSLTSATGWAPLAAALLLGILVRSASLAGTLWLADGARVAFVVPWVRTLRLVAWAPLLLLPAAVLHFTGHVIRYAPFVALGALAGVPVALGLTRRALALDVGRAVVRGRSPSVGAFLSYGYMVGLAGAGLTILGRGSALGAGLFIALLGPIHALVLLGWREQTRNSAEPGGAWVTTATALAALLLVGMSFYDRTFASPPPSPERRGRLLLLGGVDSTTESGALSEYTRGILGFDSRRTVVLSYRGAEGPYEAADTRGHLTRAARRLAGEIRTVRRPRFLLGHSQAGLILDRILVESLPLPDTSVMLAAPPPFPPGATVPPPGERAPGKPGGDAARALSGLLDVVGLAPFDVDAPASPPNLRPIVAPESPIPRLSVWALGDSIWLDSDWRRPGEVNIVALTDHVGVTKNRAAFGAADSFLRGERVKGHEVSWQGFLVSTLRYAFAPWRP